MNNLRSLPLAAVALLFSLTTACAQQDGATGTAGSGGAAPSYPTDAVAFRMEYVGGFVSPAMLATRLPTVSVYGDGRVITDGPTTLVYPGPALPNLQVGRIGAEDLANLIERARALGVGSGADLGTPTVADAPSTRFTVLGDNGVERLEVYALAEGVGTGEGLTAEQRAARNELREFAESLTSESGPLAGAEQAGSPPYVPTAVAAVAEPWAAGDEAGEQREVSWPGPALPGGALREGLGLGCVTVTGDAARTLVETAAEANAATPWSSGGRRWRVTLRPLLPEETDCADLAADR